MFDKKNEEKDSERSDMNDEGSESFKKDKNNLQ
jgi:hypothetical protein